jgi:GNAT superfamily N-acetyltransferase
MNFRIRDIALPEEKAAALSFIDGSQRYEHDVEPNRRLDEAVAAEHFALLSERMATNRGRIFVAELDGRVVGWAVFFVEQHPVFVTEKQRAHGYIAELFVEEHARSHGIGRALIDSCETEARRLGLGHIMIGVLAGNTRAADVYARAGYAPYSSELRKFL